jgi:dihydroflavonol-4-reductase
VIVFITGANGLVGSFILKEILAIGYKPILLLRDNCDTLLIKDDLPFCDIEYGDVLDSVVLNKSINGCDAVIHCAGLVSFDPSKRKAIFKVNLEGTKNVVNACIQNRVKKIIHISSIAALSRQGNSLQISESSKWEDSSYNSSYAKSKYLAELEVFRGGEEGLDFTIINPTVVVGPGDVKKSSTKLIQYIRNYPWFFPNGYVNLVDVRDVARVSCAMLTIEHKNRLILNAGVVSYKRLYELVFIHTKSPLFSVQLPKITLYLTAFWSVLKSYVVKGEPLLTFENCRHISKQYDCQSLYYDRFFNKQLVSVEESVAYTLSKLDEVNVGKS